jgi:hypothetical protein
MSFLLSKRQKNGNYKIICCVFKICRQQNKILIPSRKSGILLLITTIQNSEESNIVSPNEYFSVVVEPPEVLEELLTSIT